ncbi:hypothetical protein RND71_014823 [Anisodus tanguticus]|uniref:Protein DECREASED SIZE EXCLUSION LIMIT 1 n=1 Tax=Anisodus tanguticus TaxID=243964 RepID=A0AAE1SAB5_9SOLA|nr:hypothetical protein RND71_014823 [Anisodus tanguticus]
MAEQGMSGRPAPDPVSVLRDHRASVADICFHPSNNILFSGSTDGELRIWNTVQRRTVSSAWVHSAAHGVICVAASPVLGDNKVISQGRDGTVKCWDFGGGGLSRTPLLTLKTNSYHFCKLSIAKSPSEALKIDDLEIKENVDDMQGDQPTDSTKSKDHIALADLSLDFGYGLHIVRESSKSVLKANPSCKELSEGPKYVAIAGEQSSVVEIWDVNTAKRIAQLPHSSGSLLNQTPNQRGMCLAVQAFLPSESQGLLSVMAGYEDGSIAWWDLRNPGVPLTSVKHNSHLVFSLIILCLLSAGTSIHADKYLVIFDMDCCINSCNLVKHIRLVRIILDGIQVCSAQKIKAKISWTCRVRIVQSRRRNPHLIGNYNRSSANEWGIRVISVEELLLISGLSDTVSLHPKLGGKVCALYLPPTPLWNYTGHVVVVA